MADTLNIFGTEYTGVAGIIATTPSETDLTYIRPQGTKSISSNGTGIDVAAYASVDVSVSAPAPTLQTITKSYTPTESQQTETITASSGYDGIEEVDVTVGAISSSYVGSGITRRDSTSLSASGATVSVPSGYYASNASKAVASGSIGNPSWSNEKTTTQFKTIASYPQFTEGYISSINNATRSFTLQEETVTPSSATQTIEPSTSNSYLNKVVVEAVPSGSVTAPSTITGTSATVSTGTNTLTLSKTVSVTPSVTTAGYVSSGTAGNSSVSLTASVTTQAAQTIYPSTSDQTINSGRYLTGNQTIKAVTTTNLTADNIKSGVTVQIGDSADSDRVASVTGTYSGGGGTSKNVQVLQSTSRTNASSLTKVLGDLTVSKTGTYDIYWSGGRSNTSTSYTWGTRLYIDGTGYGTENTTWSNNCQSNHLSNVSLTVNQKLSVYARGRTGSYYTFAPMLTIVEA